jgi:hypothetical protein
LPLRARYGAPLHQPGQGLSMHRGRSKTFLARGRKRTPPRTTGTGCQLRSSHQIPGRARFSATRNGYSTTSRAVEHTAPPAAAAFGPCVVDIRWCGGGKDDKPNTSRWCRPGDREQRQPQWRHRAERRGPRRRRSPRHNVLAVTHPYIPVPGGGPVNPRIVRVRCCYVHGIREFGRLARTLPHSSCSRL